MPAKPPEGDPDDLSQDDLSRDGLDPDDLNPDDLNPDDLPDDERLSWWDPWDGDPFDPDTSPPDGDEALDDPPGELAAERPVGPPGELAAERRAGPWTGDGEAIAAGFLHRTAGPAGVGFAAGGVLDRLEPGPVLASFLADALAGGVPGGAVLADPDDDLNGDQSAAGRPDSQTAGRPDSHGDPQLPAMSASTPAGADPDADGGDRANAGGARAPRCVIGQGGGGPGIAALGESELIGVLCAARRMASLAAAQEFEAIIALARRRVAQARERKNPHLAEHISDEIAAALTLTGRAANRRLEVAGGLARLPAVRAALTVGIIDEPRAVVFADELTALSDADARAAAGQVLPDAGQMTTGQLRDALRKMVLRIDPDALRRRRQKAREDAAVQVWEEPSGNSALAGRELPRAQVIAADARLTAKAKWLQARGAQGTLDQLRAAVFAAVLADQPIESLLPGPAEGPGGPESAGPDGGRPADPASAASGPAKPGPTWPSVTGIVNLTMPLAAWLGHSEAPGEVGGHGPVDAEACRDLATWLAAHRRHPLVPDPDRPRRPRRCARVRPPRPRPRRPARIRRLAGL